MPTSFAVQDPPTHTWLPRLYLIKALTLLSLAALILSLAHPAYAQFVYGTVNGWNLTRCGPTGGPPTYLNANNLTALVGPNTGSFSKTYPANNGSYFDPAGSPYDNSTCPNCPSISLGYVYSYPWCRATNGYTAGAVPVIINGSVTADVTGTLSAYFKWTVPQGMFGPVLSPLPQPDHVDLLVTSTLSASTWDSCDQPTSGLLLSATATATDTLGDTLAATGPFGTSSTMTGYHLVRSAMGGNGVMAVSLTGAVHGYASNTASYQTYGSANVYANASITGTVGLDNREVTISCPAVDTNANGGSKYRDPPLTGAIITNVRGADGTLRGDTANYAGFSNGGITLDYTGAAIGTWAVGSDYHWNSSLAGNSANGLWPNINLFTATEPFGPNIQPSDHIFISLYNAGNKAEATGNYYMYFHNTYEPASYPEDSGYPRKQTTQSDPDMPSWPTYFWHAEVNPNTNIIDSAVGKVSASTNFSYGGTETESWSLDGGLGIPVKPVDLHFGGGYTHDIVNKFSASNVAIPVDLLIGQKTWAVYRQDIKRHRGHLDIYGANGYTSTGIWYRDEAVGTEHSVYFPYANAVTDNAHDPAPGWNPGS